MAGRGYTPVLANIFCIFNGYAVIPYIGKVMLEGQILCFGRRDIQLGPDNGLLTGLFAPVGNGAHHLSGIGFVPEDNNDINLNITGHGSHIVVAFFPQDLLIIGVYRHDGIAAGLQFCGYAITGPVGFGRAADDDDIPGGGK